MDRLLPELIEEILLNFPQKDLVRFSVVSKSWKSIIFDPVFARKHKNRAALLRRHRLVVNLNAYFSEDAYFYSLDPISSDLHIKVVFPDTNSDARSQDFAGQFEGKPYLRACCDELLCVHVEGHLFLWNPSMRNIMQLPDPLSFTGVIKDSDDYFSYGLAYDSVNDDYKILKIGRRCLSSTTELYSLKDDCWRKIESVSSDFTPSSSSNRCEFVDGSFHWIAGLARTLIIASFDLSTEKYGEVALPPYHHDRHELEVVSLNGMLCASVNYSYDNDQGRFVLWVMEEYGVEKSWTKRFDIMLPHLMLRNVCTNPEKLTPLYFSDNNDLLVKRYGCCAEDMFILMYSNGEATPMWEIVKNEYCDEADAFLYVESLITLHKLSKKR